MTEENGESGGPRIDLCIMNWSEGGSRKHWTHFSILIPHLFLILSLNNLKSPRVMRNMMTMLILE